MHVLEHAGTCRAQSTPKKTAHRGVLQYIIRHIRDDRISHVHYVFNFYLDIRDAVLDDTKRLQLWSRSAHYVAIVVNISASIE